LGSLKTGNPGTVAGALLSMFVTGSLAGGVWLIVWLLLSRKAVASRAVGSRAEPAYLSILLVHPGDELGTTIAFSREESYTAWARPSAASDFARSA
jgi:hypothetical protein